MKEYLYDPHVHTLETSLCGRIPAKTLVETYHEKGYAGIVVTDHLHETYISSLTCHDDWDACVDRFLLGYNAAKQRGAELGFDVLLGAELRFEQESNNDYLVYGIDEAFLRRNPYPYRMDPHDFFDTFKNEVLIIHAHPFREQHGPILYDCVHGIEYINCSPRHENGNEEALALCMENPHLFRTCSSDTHRPGDEGRAAMVFDRRLFDSFDYKRAVEQGAYRLKSEEFQHLITKCNAHFGGRN